MALIEKKITDLIEVLENGCLQIREANVIEKDGVVIAKTFHRYVLSPGDDLADKEQKIKNIAEVVWTKDVVESYKSSVENI